MELEKEIVVVTSRHDCSDNRIYEKQIKSLLKAGFKVVYVYPKSLNSISESNKLKAICLKSNFILSTKISPD